MIQKQVTVKNSLDAREAAFFVQTASKFNAEVQVSVEERKINAKSIMGTIALNMQEGQIATIYADGVEEELAIAELVAILG